VYEAHWADLLPAGVVTGTFTYTQPHVIAWFPWLNLRTRSYPPRLSMLLLRLRVVLWTCFAAPTALGAQLLIGTAHAAAYVASRTPQLHSLLDEVVGDVMNYVDSAAGTLPPASPLHDVASHATARLLGALDAAKADGCEQVAVVAHSLGSVVAARTLFPDAQVDSTSPPVHLFTIGSPLKTVGFIWPDVLTPSSPGVPSDMEWDNYSNPLDVISNRLKDIPGWPTPRNHRLTGRAGLARAHTTYHHHPRFIRDFARSIGASPPAVRLAIVVRSRLFLGSIGESAAVLTFLCLSLVAGFGLCVAIAAVLALLLALGSEKSVMSAAEEHLVASNLGWIALITVAVILVALFLVAPISYGRYEAGRRHYGHRWGGVPPAMPAPSTAWASDPRRPWNRKYADRAFGWLLVVIVAACLVAPIALGTFHRGEHWAVKAGAGHLLATVVGLAAIGAGWILLVLLSGCFLFIAIAAGAAGFYTTRECVRYRNYLRLLMRPPQGHEAAPADEMPTG
jgi:hypothetical protein